MGLNPSIRTVATGAYKQQLDNAFDDAAFLWLLRDNAVSQPNYDWSDLVEHDLRISSLLNILACSPEDAWKIACVALELQQPGEVFIAAVLAFRSLDIRNIQTVVEVGLADSACARALVSALAWLPGRLVHSWIKKFLTSKDLQHKYLALAVCSARREDPKEQLSNILLRDDCRENQLLYAKAVRLAGELKRFDLLPAIRLAQQSKFDDVIFWAVRSQILLGDKALASALTPWIIEAGDLQRYAINVGLRTGSLNDARAWITALSQNPKMQRQAIWAAAILGDPQTVPWLIGQMQNASLSRLAGEAFSTITGINLPEHQLALNDIPDLDEVLPDDGAQNEALSVSDDQFLPFPDVPKISAIWQRYQHRFHPGKRYFQGFLLNGGIESLEHLRHIYKIGNQRLRASAALELALEETGKYYLSHQQGAALIE